MMVLVKEADGSQTRAAARRVGEADATRIFCGEIDRLGGSADPERIRGIPDGRMYAWTDGRTDTWVSAERSVFRATEYIARVCADGMTKGEVAMLTDM